MKQTKKSNGSSEIEIIALKALNYIVRNNPLLELFINQTGITPEILYKCAEDRAVLGGVLDFLLSKEQNLLEFCETEDISPIRIGQLRKKLPGATIE